MENIADKKKKQSERRRDEKSGAAYINKRFYLSYIAAFAYTKFLLIDLTSLTFASRSNDDEMKTLQNHFLRLVSNVA